MPDRYELVFEASGYVVTTEPTAPEPAPENDPTDNEEK
jgi:hypothetical protein